MFDILIPTFGRSERLADVVKNIRSYSEFDHRIHFITEPGDYLSEEAIFELADKLEDVYLIRNKSSPGYSACINTAFEWLKDLDSGSEFFFCGSDDLNFHKGWDTELVKAIDQYRDVQVFGTNDLYNKYVLTGKHATHFLVRYEYIKKSGGVVDNSYPVLFEYKHNYCDSEFIDTAKARGVFRSILTSVVEHKHHLAGKAKRDSTYSKNDSTIKKDRHTYQIRSSMVRAINENSSPN